nr:hypothetical protein [Gilliamella apicola]
MISLSIIDDSASSICVKIARKNNVALGLSKLHKKPCVKANFVEISCLIGCLPTKQVVALEANNAKAKPYKESGTGIA